MEIFAMVAVATAIFAVITPCIMRMSMHNR